MQKSSLKELFLHYVEIIISKVGANNTISNTILLCLTLFEMVVVYKPIILKHRVNKEADKKQGVGFL